MKSTDLCYIKIDCELGKTKHSSCVRTNSRVNLCTSAVCGGEVIRQSLVYSFIYWVKLLTAWETFDPFILLHGIQLPCRTCGCAGRTAISAVVTIVNYSSRTSAWSGVHSLALTMCSGSLLQMENLSGMKRAYECSFSHTDPCLFLQRNKRGKGECYLLGHLSLYHKWLL